METPVNDLTLSVTSMAQTVLVDMMAKVEEIRNYYGPDDERTHKAADSLLRNVIPLFGTFFGTENVITKDGDLSLFVNNRVRVKPEGEAFLDGELKTSYVFGIIWHQDRRKCTVCGTTEHIDPKYRNANYADVPPCETHQWDEPDEAPRTGSWSFHS